VKLLKLPLIAGLIFLISYSCRERGGKYITQGEINYNIEYLGGNGTMSLDLKPKSLVVTFKNNKILFELLSPIGNQGITNLVNPETKVYDTYLNMLSVRYYYAGAAGEMHPGFSSMEGIQIKKTSRLNTVCGYNCKNAEVTFASDRNKIYNIWYTDEIRVKNSNASTPYHEIDGVLMSFYFILGNSELKFDAESVFQKDIPDKVFERRPKFRLVSRGDMDKILTDMVNL
jgi:hypothetical protein